ncbi:MAG: PDZ domain-containing protein, partial [Acidimicrobiia bacterium]|nr:PDZ domain-containing protein [Acidimicrobiia bacterium]
MKPVLVAALLILSACSAQTAPTRSRLPDVQQAVAPITPCGVAIGDGAGVAVTSVTDGSAADGVLAVGDVIVDAAGMRLSTAEDLLAALAEFAPGETFDVRVQRAGEMTPLQVVLGADSNDPDLPRIGIGIETRYEYVSPNALGEVDGATPLGRLIDIEGLLYRLDPTTGALSPTTLEAPDRPWDFAAGRLVTTREDNGSIALTASDGTAPSLDESWELLGLLGGVDEDLVLFANSEAGLFVARVDAISGAEVWRSDLVSSDLPVSVVSVPGGSMIGVLFASVDDAGLASLAGFEVWDAGTGEIVLDVGTELVVFGWYDDTHLLAQN